MIAAVVVVCLQSAPSFDVRMATLEARRASMRHQVWVSERSGWQRIITMNEARFGEGVVPERDLIQARVEGGLLDLEVSQSQLELEAARRRLAAELGSPESELPDLEDSAEPGFPPLPPLDLDRPELAQAASEYETARDQISTFRLRLLASCAESVEIEELLYEQLKTSLWTLLDARRTCRGIRLRYIDTLHRAESARIRLRSLLGR
ncbi:MAG: hypothetical protein ACRD21_21235, partial [Vicinamibacteria bacterium]